MRRKHGRRSAATSTPAPGREEPAEPGAAPSTEDKRPVLRAYLPGAQFYQLAIPSGIPTNDFLRRNQFNCLRSCDALAHLPEEERDALIESCGKTYLRGAYHEFRFNQLRAELDQRRALVPGEVFWDALVEFVHFELQGFSAATRTLLDELVYLVARRHAVPEKDARKARRWETNALIREPLHSDCRVDEVEAMRRRESWYVTLNAFRNSSFHHGWRHGGGHFGPDELRNVANEPASNGLLVPDPESLAGRSKPHEWTWNLGMTVDDVASAVRHGTESLLDEILQGMWHVPYPSPGTVPEHHRPNMMVKLPRPVLLHTPRGTMLPLFSTRDLAQACEPFCDRADLELVDVRATARFDGRREFLLSLTGLELTTLPGNRDSIEIVVDPEPRQGWAHVESATRTTLAVAEVSNWIGTQPLEILADPLGLTCVWVWAGRVSRDW